MPGMVRANLLLSFERISVLTWSVLMPVTSSPSTAMMIMPTTTPDLAAGESGMTVTT